MEISGFPRGGVHVSKRGVRVGAPILYATVHIYTSNLESRVAVSVREREQSCFKECSEYIFLHHVPDSAVVG